MANDQAVGELERFLAERGDRLMRTGAVHEKQARVEWTLYVNPTTYLPVRMVGSTETFGGPARSTRFASVTDASWLRPTRANIASTLVTIPAGFHQVSSAASQ